MCARGAKKKAPLFVSDVRMMVAAGAGAALLLKAGFEDGLVTGSKDSCGDRVKVPIALRPAAPTGAAFFGVRGTSEFAKLLVRDARVDVDVDSAN